MDASEGIRRPCATIELKEQLKTLEDGATICFLVGTSTKKAAIGFGTRKRELSLGSELGLELAAAPRACNPPTRTSRPYNLHPTIVSDS